MSRIGKQPVEIQDGVEVKVDEANVVTVRGPRRELTPVMHPTMRILRRKASRGSSDRTTSASAAACAASPGRSSPTWSKG